MINLEQQVKKANKDFYDIVGVSYEEIDGRRTEELNLYVADQLKIIAQNTDADSILDLGCGSGFVSSVAKGYFKHRYAVDISLKIIEAIDDNNLMKIAADSDAVPIKDERLSSVVAFAVLHHCYSFQDTMAEIYRVLKNGGIFYSDHDMDSLFFKHFMPLLRLYRRINDSGKRYISRFGELSEEIYHCSEFRQDGIDSERIKWVLKNVGFSEVMIQYHWYGLSALTDRIFGKRVYMRGYAPLVKIMAVK